ncbi:MAG: PDZ domain-containing protein, partial [Pedobacter sp.]
YYAGGKDYKRIIINRIEPGSAADLIGLEKDDEITAINFKPVHKMTLEEIDEIFRSKDNRAVVLRVYHDNEYDSVVLKLKRRI